MPTVSGIPIHPMTPPLVENESQNATCGANSPAAHVRRTFAPSRPSSRCTFRPIRSADRARRAASVQRSSLEDWVPAQDARQPPIAVKPALTQDDIDLLCVGPTLSTAEVMMQQGGIAFNAGSQLVARAPSQGRAFGTTSTAAGDHASPSFRRSWPCPAGSFPFRSLTRALVVPGYCFTQGGRAQGRDLYLDLYPIFIP